MLMPYGQKKREEFISIDINALRAKEQTKFKQLLKILWFFVETAFFDDYLCVWGIVETISALLERFSSYDKDWFGLNT